MKRLLLDTHIVLWWLMADPRLRPATVAILANPENVLFISAASLWEIRIKQAAGRLVLPSGFEKALADMSYEEVPVSIAHTAALLDIPLLHGDPFDRILLAQARAEKLMLLSADKSLLAYGNPVIKA